MTSAAASLSPALTPSGHLRLLGEAEAPPLAPALAERLGAAFARGSGPGLLELGARDVASVLPPLLAWWRDFAVRYVSALCATPEGAPIAVAAPDAAVLDALAADVPPMRGAEYLSGRVLAALWAELDAAARAALDESGQPLAELL